MRIWRPRYLSKLDCGQLTTCMKCHWFVLLGYWNGESARMFLVVLEIVNLRHENRTILRHCRGWIQVKFRIHTSQGEVSSPLVRPTWCPSASVGGSNRFVKPWDYYNFEHLATITAITRVMCRFRVKGLLDSRGVLERNTWIQLMFISISMPWTNVYRLAICLW